MEIRDAVVAHIEDDYEPLLKIVDSELCWHSVSHIVTLVPEKEEYR